MNAVGLKSGESVAGDEDFSGSSLVKNLLERVRNQVHFANETLEQAGALGTLSRMFGTLKDLDNTVLKPIRDAGILTFDFHPPVEIPIHTPKAIKTIKDDEFNLALTLIGSHVGETMIGNHTSVATQDQVIGNIVMGAEMIKPAVVDISHIGFMLYELLDEFDHSGAMINGKPMDTVRAINIQASGPSFLLIRPKILRTEAMTNTLTLPEIDEWRRRRLAVVGSMAQDAKLDKEAMTRLLEGIQLGPIFPNRP